MYHSEMYHLEVYHSEMYHSLGDVSPGDVLPVGLTLSSVSCWSWVFALCSGRTHDILGLLLELGIGPLLW
jgi:hypothetical protein